VTINFFTFYNDNLLFSFWLQQVITITFWYFSR